MVDARRRSHDDFSRSVCGACEPDFPDSWFASQLPDTAVDEVGVWVSMNADLIPGEPAACSQELHARLSSALGDRVVNLLGYGPVDMGN